MIQLSSTPVLSNAGTVPLSFLPTALPELSMVQLFDCPAKFTTRIIPCSLAETDKDKTNFLITCVIISPEFIYLKLTQCIHLKMIIQ